MDKILILGAGGQIGLELTEALNEKYGADQVIISDIKEPQSFENFSNKYLNIDVTDRNALREVIITNKVSQVYHMAALLSATAEQHPDRAWAVNIGSLLSLLDIAKDKLVEKIYWPSSIAVYGETTPKQLTPQHTITEPSTVYGIAKYAGELWCKYYKEKHNVDVRSLRYPGIISWKSQPGGGTTDYAVEIYHAALNNETFNCYLSPTRALPMMYMDDAIRATVEVMSADLSDLSISMAYNISAISFTPEEIAEDIRKSIPNFKIEYNPDFRDNIASSWPESIEDTVAQKDWNWKAKYNLQDITQTMLKSLKTCEV